MSRPLHVVLFSLILLFILAVALVGWDTDFQVYQQAVQAYRAGGWAAVYQPEAVTPYKYHPFVVFLLFPLGFLSPKVALALWTVLNGAALYDALRRLKQHTQCPDWVLPVALGCVIHAFFWQVRFSNVTIIMLWLFTIAATTLSKWREILSVSLLVLFKPFWVALLPAYFFNRNFKRLIEITGVVIVACVVVVLIGFNSGQHAYDLWLQTLAHPTNALNYPKSDNQCFYAVLYRNRTLLPGATLPYWLVGTGLYFLWWGADVLYQKRRHDQFFLFISLLPPILFAGPLTWIHHQILLIPVFIYLLKEGRYAHVALAWLLLNGTAAWVVGPTAYEWLAQAGVPVLGYLALSAGLAGTPALIGGKPLLVEQVEPSLT